LPKAVGEKIRIGHQRVCDCPPNHINCLTPKDWIKNQLGVWQFNYEKRDVRDKRLHPATYPISLARRLIELFSHRGELILDPFVGSGTTLIAARDAGRNALGFDLKEEYVELSRRRLKLEGLFGGTEQIAICDDARNIPRYVEENTVACIVTSPPYANLLNRERRNKSRRSDERKNAQFLKVEQYSQDEKDLGILEIERYEAAMGEIFSGLLPLLKIKGHCVINVPDMWWEDKRITIHMSVIRAMENAGFELRNIIIWDRTNVVNKIGIFGWPSNYITMGVTYEYLLDFWRPRRDPK